MNILEGTPKYPCTSCQMCGAVCPKSAISVSLDKEGFYRPSVERELCIDCELCTKVCYKFDNDIKQFSTGDLLQTKLYAASAIDDKIVESTTSGGIADLLARSLINKGYKVIGASYCSESNNVIHEIADSIDKTKRFRGSKYIQSYSVDAFRKIVKRRSEEKYAVFGLPCQIYAISKYLDRIHARDKFVLIDLFCHGCPTMLAWSKVSDSLKDKLHTKAFTFANWRSKQRGWGSFVLEVHTNTGKSFTSKPMSNEFFDFFFSNQLLNESCTDCRVRGSLAYTDIRLGDFWGKEYDKTFRGVSGVSIATKTGADLFKSISSEIEMVEKDYSSFLPYQSWNHKYKINPRLRSELMALLQDKSSSLSQCVAPIRRRRSKVDRFKIYIKQALCYLPDFVEKRIRQVIK